MSEVLEKLLHLLSYLLVEVGLFLAQVGVEKTDTFSTAAATWTDVTGMTATITPDNTSQEVDIEFTFGGSTSATALAHLRLMRGATPIFIGDVAGSRIQASSIIYDADGSDMLTVTISGVDSPATTSPVTYKLQVQLGSGGGSFVLNRTNTDSDSSVYARTRSQIKLRKKTP